MSSRRLARLRIVVLCGALLWVTPALAQTPAPAPAPNYFFPDLPASTLIYDGKAFWFKPIIAPLLDYTQFEQDDASVAQVGEQEDGRDLRAFRLGFYLRPKGKVAWEFFIAADYQERRTREKTTFNLYDLRITVPIGRVKASVGKMKTPFGYEVVGLAAQLPQQERILLPFMDSRNIGVHFAGPLAGERMTWAAGVFNDWLESGLPIDKNATNYVGRVTALPWVSPDNEDFFHLGLGLQYRGADDGMMRFKGRPESNVTDYYIDTRDFAADHANEMAWELFWQRSGVVLMAERVDAWVDAPQSGRPHFAGYYMTAAWVPTGEGRKYVRAIGSASGIVPKGRYGAAELVAKFTHIDAADAAIDGGVLDKWNFGVNWWASAQWKIGTSYGIANLDRAGLKGNTRMWLNRVQWLW